MSFARGFYNTAVYTEHYLGIRWPKAIWAAVLKQAIKDVVEGPGVFERPHADATLAEMNQFRREIQVAAQRWIDDDVNEPRRFVWVCEQLGLDPDAVRRELEERVNK